MSTKTFLPGDRVQIQDPKTLRWSVTGVVTKAIYHQGASQPSSYEITIDSGGSFLRNGKFLRLHEEQNIPEKTMNADRESEIHAGEREQPQMAISHDQTVDNKDGHEGTIHGDSMNADRESDKHSRQRTDSGREGREGGSTSPSGPSNRRSSRIAGQLRVRYSDNGRRNFKGDSKGRSTYKPRG